MKDCFRAFICALPCTVGTYLVYYYSIYSRARCFIVWFNHDLNWTRYISFSKWIVELTTLNLQIYYKNKCNECLGGIAYVLSVNILCNACIPCKTVIATNYCKGARILFNSSASILLCTFIMVLKLHLGFNAFLTKAL